jgi:hypothetical protein
MKKLIIIAALFLSMNVNAQEPQKKVEYNKESKTFKTSKTKVSNDDQLTSYLWEDSKGNTYPIWLHTYTKGKNKGKTTCFVFRVSQETGKEYKYYLPNGIEIAEQILKDNL